MAVYNVLTAVVDEIKADSEEDAIRRHAALLRASGHEPHEDGPANAFLSENQEG